MLASRSILALTTTALLATGAAMAAAGPEKRVDVSVHVNIGGGGWGGWGPHWPYHPHPVYLPAPTVVVVPAPVVVARPVVVQQPVVVAAPVIADLAPRNLELQAYQAAGTVIIFARGENITTGFTTTFDHLPDARKNGVTCVTLHNLGPANCEVGASAQPAAQFTINGGFETKERLSEIHVIVAGQDHVVPVERIAHI